MKDKIMLFFIILINIKKSILIVSWATSYLILSPVPSCNKKERKNVSTYKGVIIDGMLMD